MYVEPWCFHNLNHPAIGQLSYSELQHLILLRDWIHQDQASTNSSSGKLGSQKAPNAVRWNTPKYTSIKRAGNNHLLKRMSRAVELASGCK